MIMMTLKVDPSAEQGARMWNRDRLWKRVNFIAVLMFGSGHRLRKRVSLVKNSNDRCVYFDKIEGTHPQFR